MTSVVRQLCEEIIKMDRKMYAVLVVLENAHDKVCSEELWRTFAARDTVCQFT